MAVTRASASLVAHGLNAAATAAAFSARIGVAPTRAKEIGDLSGNGRSGRRYEQSLWKLAYESEGTAPLDTAFSSLLVVLQGKAEVVAELAADYDLRLWAFGSSDSTQGGFWLSADVMRRIGELGVDFYGDIFLSDEDDTDDGVVGQ